MTLGHSDFHLRKMYSYFSLLIYTHRKANENENVFKIFLTNIYYSCLYVIDELQAMNRNLMNGERIFHDICLHMLMSLFNK